MRTLEASALSSVLFLFKTKNPRAVAGTLRWAIVLGPPGIHNVPDDTRDGDLQTGPKLLVLGFILCRKMAHDVNVI